MEVSEKDIFVVFTQNILSPHLTVGDDHEASLAVTGSVLAMSRRQRCRSLPPLAVFLPFKSLFQDDRGNSKALLFWFYYSGEAPALSPASLRLSGTNQQRARH